MWRILAGVTDIASKNLNFSHIQVNLINKNVGMYVAKVNMHSLFY